MTMPDEILIEICEKMCHRCSDYIYHEGALSRLSLTCRHLRDIAQPILHHYAAPENMVPFVRTLIERPDLAAQVRTFFTPDTIDRGAFETDIEVFQAEAQRLNHGNRNKWTRATLGNKIKCHHRLFELALALLPNVKEITLLVPCKPEQELDGLFGAPVALKSVHSLTVVPWDPVNFGRFRGILAMMPRLERLEIEECYGITQTLPLTELRTLIISQSGIGTRSLQNIIESCPKLEHFGYHNWAKGYPPKYFDFEEECTWGSAQYILRSRKKTLKHLNFIFKLGCHVGLGPEDYLGSFRDFDVLETLWLLSISFSTTNIESRAPIFPKDVQDLVNMLPQSLTCLGLCCPREDWQGIKTLALAIQEGHFSKLKQVVVQQTDSEYDKSCEILAPLNVSCFNLSERCREEVQYYFDCYLRREYPRPVEGWFFKT